MHTESLDTTITQGYSGNYSANWYVCHVLFHLLFQVYQGADICHHLSDLKPGHSYSVRVCPIRICGGDHPETVVGAYNQPTSFKTNKPASVVEPSKPSATPVSPPVWKEWLKKTVAAVKPDPEKQFVVIALCLLFIISVLLSMVMFYFVG